MSEKRLIVAIACGGAVGSMARYGLSLLSLSAVPGWFFAGTLALSHSQRVSGYRVLRRVHDVFGIFAGGFASGHVWGMGRGAGICRSFDLELDGRRVAGLERGHGAVWGKRECGPHQILNGPLS